MDAANLPSRRTACTTFSTRTLRRQASRGNSPSQRAQQVLHRRVIPKRAADVQIPVHIARPEDETAPQLKRILPQFMLPVAPGARAVAGGLVIAAQQVQKIRVARPGGAVRQPFLRS